MLVINTIADFQRLPGPQQTEILKAIRTKERLEAWLWALNDPKPAKPAVEKPYPGWDPCPRCASPTPSSYAVRDSSRLRLPVSRRSTTLRSRASTASNPSSSA